jgi:hypothetical protein
MGERGGGCLSRAATNVGDETRVYLEDEAYRAESSGLVGGAGNLVARIALRCGEDEVSKCVLVIARAAAASIREPLGSMRAALSAT